MKDKVIGKISRQVNWQVDRQVNEQFWQADRQVNEQLMDEFE